MQVDHHLTGSRPTSLPSSVSICETTLKNFSTTLNKFRTTLKSTFPPSSVCQSATGGQGATTTRSNCPINLADPPRSHDGGVLRALAPGGAVESLRESRRFAAKHLDRAGHDIQCHLCIFSTLHNAMQCILCKYSDFRIPVCVCILLSSKHVGKNAQSLLHIWIEVDLVKKS